MKCWDVIQCAQRSSPNWTDVQGRFPNAKVVETKTDLIVNLNQTSFPTNIVLAAFGTPAEGSKKRMQLITFAKHWPKEGRVEVSVLLIGDTQNAFEVRQRCNATLKKLTCWYMFKHCSILLTSESLKWDDSIFGLFGHTDVTVSSSKGYLCKTGCSKEEHVGAHGCVVCGSRRTSWYQDRS